MVNNLTMKGGTQNVPRNSKAEGIYQEDGTSLGIDGNSGNESVSLRTWPITTGGAVIQPTTKTSQTLFTVASFQFLYLESLDRCSQSTDACRMKAWMHLLSRKPLSVQRELFCSAELSPNLV